MNKLTIIGNLTNDPELRSTTTGKSVTNFTVAVNRKKKIENQPEADFFRVNVWNQLAENCAKYLAKGRKVAVVGSVSLRTWGNNEKHGASMEVMAEEVEFLSPKSDSVDKQSGMTKVEPPDDFPY